MMYKFLIPGFYLLYSRIKRTSELLSLLIVYPFFLFAFIAISLGEVTWDYVLTFLIALITWLSFYEIGYLENDTVTIKNEKNPTLRIDWSEIKFIRHKFFRIQLIKIVISIVGLILLYFLNGALGLRLAVLEFILFIVMARISFFLHNKLRSRWNILTYFLLSSCKYLSLVSLFLMHYNFLFLAIGLLLVFPIPRTLEHACKVKYQFVLVKKIIGDFDKFRLLWYSSGLSILIVLSLFYDQTWLISILIGFVWFFTYRLFAFLIIRFSNYNRSKFKSQEWDSND